jgi:predicted ATPase
VINRPGGGVRRATLSAVRGVVAFPAGGSFPSISDRRYDGGTMIEKVRFQNFKSLRNVQVNLTRLTVIVGPNASGKTSLLQGIELLADAAHTWQGPRFLNVVSSPSSLRSASSEGYVTISASGVVSNSLAEVEVRFDNSSTRFEAKYGGLQIVREQPGHVPRRVLDEGELAFIDEFIGPAVLLQLDAVALARPSHSEDQVPELSPNGAGLASVLAEMKLRREGDFDAVERALVSIIPGVKKVRLDRVKVHVTEWESDGSSEAFPRERRVIERKVWGDRVRLDFQGASGIPASDVSEGTLLVLGLLVALRAPERPQLILLDDCERGLHPLAMGELIKQLRGIQSDNQGIQIIATSHSPYLIDHLSPEEVRLAVANAHGGSVLGNLADHSDFERWKEAMLPGEFWSMVGEQWLLEKKGHAHAGA